MGFAEQAKKKPGRMAAMRSNLNIRRNRTGHLWQNRFYSAMLAASHLWVAIGYAERNPVRARIVERPEDYRWSSARAHLTGVDDSGLLDMDFWRREGGSERWRCNAGGSR
jgi:hypothetical protein